MPDPAKPNALKLHLRASEADPWQVRPLERDSEAGMWSAIVSAFEVKNGFSYKVTGGDGATPEYRIDVRSGPLLEEWTIVRTI